MSFANEAKKEVLKKEIDNDCCSLAFLSAVVKCSGVLAKQNNEYNIEVYTELKELHEKINEILLQYYNKQTTLQIADDGMVFKTIRYKINFPKEITNDLLMDLGVASREKDGGININNGIEKFMILEEHCKRAYIKGAFVACATSNIIIKNYENVQKSTSGYHLEFVFNFEIMANDFVKLLKELNISSKITKRKGLYVVYIKEYQIICDALALVGAFKSVLMLQNEAAIRDVRNNVNRQTNCFNANISKTVAASVKQMQDIEIIKNTIGIESLNEGLAELCLIRIANPEEPLEKLTQLYSQPITKSGINHRFKKLEKIANSLRKENN